MARSSFTFAKITQFVKRAYYAYFGVKLGDQDKAFAFHSVGFGELMLATTSEMDCPPKTSFTSDFKNVKFTRLVNPQNTFLPPLHIKLGLMRNCTIALDKDGPKTHIIFS